MKSFLILFAAVAPPALLYAALSETDFAAVRELAPWALMLLGFGGMAAAVRAHGAARPPIPRTVDFGAGPAYDPAVWRVRRGRAKRENA